MPVTLQRLKGKEKMSSNLLCIILFLISTRASLVAGLSAPMKETLSATGSQQV